MTGALRPFMEATQETTVFLKLKPDVKGPRWVVGQRCFGSARTSSFHWYGAEDVEGWLPLDTTDVPAEAFEMALRTCEALRKVLDDLTAAARQLEPLPIDR